MTQYTEPALAGTMIHVLDDRQCLLESLDRSVSLGEANAKVMFQAFDLDSRLVRADYHPQPAPIIDSDSPQQRVPSNPFLSTPMRQRHFPRLSPATLRRLLRSPSIRIDSPDSSIEIVNPPCPDQEETSDLIVPHSIVENDELASNRRVVSLISADVSPSAIQNFRRVVAEISHTNAEKPPSSPPKDIPQLLPSLVSPDSFDRPTTMSRHAGQLEAEYANLLEEKAAQEERDADWLVGLAIRLRALAKQRLELARVLEPITLP